MNEAKDKEIEDLKDSNSENALYNEYKNKKGISSELK